MNKINKKYSVLGSDKGKVEKKSVERDMKYRGGSRN